MLRVFLHRVLALGAWPQAEEDETKDRARHARELLLPKFKSDRLVRRRANSHPRPRTCHRPPRPPPHAHAPPSALRRAPRGARSWHAVRAPLRPLRPAGPVSHRPRCTPGTTLRSSAFAASRRSSRTTGLSARWRVPAPLPAFLLRAPPRACNRIPPLTGAASFLPPEAAPLRTVRREARVLALYAKSAPRIRWSGAGAGLPRLSAHAVPLEMLRACAQANQLLSRAFPFAHMPRDLVKQYLTRFYGTRHVEPPHAARARALLIAGNHPTLRMMPLPQNF